MSFFYNLNKRLAELAAKQDAAQLAESKQAEAVAQSPLTKALNEGATRHNTERDWDAHNKELLAAKAKYRGEIIAQKAAEKAKNQEKEKTQKEEMAEAGYSAKKARAGKDIGKPGKNFAKIAKGAAERYGSKEAGERVAGAVLNKLRHPKEAVEKDGDVMDYLNDKLKDYDAQQTKEGNAFTGALAKTPKGGKFKVGNKEFTDTSSLEEADITGLEEGYAEMDAWLKSREKEKGTGKFDVKDTGYSKRYTRKLADEPADDEEASDTPKKKGRPAGSKRAIGAKVKGTSKLHRKDAIAECDPAEYDEEGDMAKDNLETMVLAAKELHSILGDNDNLPEWVQAKITKALDYINTANDYIHSEKRDMHDEVAEVAPPGAKAERMVKHIKKSLSKDGKLSKKDKAIAYATTWKAHNAGKVEEEGGDKPDYIDLDKDGDKKEPMKQAAKQAKAKGKKEEVEETTTAGSVATAPAAPKSSKGMQFGKGVYESMNSKVENMISEEMNVTVNLTSNTNGGAQKSITVTATDEDADKLAELLKMAGIEHKEETCEGCGCSPCECIEEELDENSPDWPTNDETLDAEPNLRTYSGGLNGPKSTGQTTVPVIASQLRRQTSMEESVELERTLFDLYKNYKG